MHDQLHKRLHPALISTLQIVEAEAPGVYEDLADSLQQILQGILESKWPAVSWEFSCLTGNGFPVEFSFSTNDNALRFVSEINGPECSYADRVYYVQHLLESCNVPVLPSNLLHEIVGLQSNSHLDYGVWMGCRLTQEGRKYKLYFEMPPGSKEVTERYLGEKPLLADRTERLRMLGYDPVSGRTELYFRANDLELRHLKELLLYVNLENQFEPLVELIQGMTNRWRGEVLPSNPVGFSISISPTGAPPIFGIFLFARSLCCSDKAIRQKVMKLSEHRGWEMDLYNAFTRPIADRTSFLTAHGMFSFIAAAGVEPFMHVGVSPFSGD